MKATGIIRKMDDLGRIVIPMEIRRTMNIKTGEPIEIFVDEGGLILRKYAISCVICGCREKEQLVKINGVAVCKHCINKLR
ncbi:MAG: AbrB/MazE/SpoVT family DNA-binding domain-containing protein [Oscillospiraceae bacterium]